ncbi:MAG TPA: O-antigen ligase family protein [Rhizomicrobium sp.]|jgi:O-antigen ligase|nr:O-antigen ligase family protein [Rhizomicrobium sp.]
MVGEAAFRPAAMPVRLTWNLAELAFLGFLFLIFVTLEPFATRDAVTLAGGESGFTGAGDALRQVAYLAVFLFVAFAAVRQRGFDALFCIPPLFAALLAWCALSAAWSAAPDVVFRRAVLEIVIVMSAMMGVATLGMERSIALLRVVLGAVLVINWLSIPLVHNAIHLPGETDPALVGDWRGLYFHKNIAGSVSAITAILFFFRALKHRPLLNGAFCAGALGFTIMTASKSSIGLLPLAIAAGCIYARIWRDGIDRAIAAVVMLLAVLAGCFALTTHLHAVLHALSDPTELTGRTAIWTGEIGFIRDHLLLGAGFGSFADTGGASPLHAYVADKWVQNISHGHNAYLQLLVTIGVPGFALAMIVFILAPARQLWRFDPAQAGAKAVLAAVFVFMALHNSLESDFLEGEDPAWVGFLLMLAMLRGFDLARPRTGYRRGMSP